MITYDLTITHDFMHRHRLTHNTAIDIVIHENMNVHRGTNLTKVRVEKYYHLISDKILICYKKFHQEHT